MKRVTQLTSAVLSVLLMASCGSETVYPQNEGGGKAVQEIIAKHFDGEKQVQALTIKSADKLYGELGEIAIVYWDGDREMEQVYSSASGLKAPEETFASKQKLPSLKKNNTLAIKSFDVEPIPYKIGEASAFIPDEY